MSKVAADKKTLLNTLAPKNNLQLCPAEGALAHRAASSVLHAAVRASPCTSARLALHKCRKTVLIFHFLGDRELRDSFLDPQSGESGRRVGVPALSHQFAHHTESLECGRENTIICLFKVHVWVELVEY